MIPKIGTRGKTAEKLALKHLKSQGLTLVTENYHCRYGEIDLIMSKAETLIFVEVKYREKCDFGGALASVTSSKIDKLRRTAEHYLMTNKLSDIDCRFDMVGLSGKLSKPEIDWITNAF